ncbi:hypothetical protein [Rubrivirga sp.]|uniref:hypothetical protein n=1 Tax=Rubrivirga sp. TaxID=1885344 RepID=UPI003C73336C
MTFVDAPASTTGPEITADEAYLAPTLAAEAHRAGRFTFTDWHGRRIAYYLTAGAARNGGLWTASVYDAGVGTVNVYAGAHRPGRRAIHPSALSVAGLLRVSLEFARRLGTTEAQQATSETSSDGRCPTCGHEG